MQDAEYNLQRAYLPGTSVNEGDKKQCIWGCVASQMLLLMCTWREHREGASAETGPFSRGKEEEVRTKVALMIAMVVVLVALVGSGTALAQTIGGVIQCQTMPCVATGNHQVLFERVGDGVPDKLIAQGGHDHLDARAYTNDRDVAKGSGGHDLLRVNDGDTMDGAIGGPGSDLCVVDAAIEAADTCEGVIFR
jgi:hypothetical protein